MTRPDAERPERDIHTIGKRRPVWPQRLAVSAQGMVSAQHYLAAAAGARQLERGGNAFDAAVAAAFALCVCEPAASGLGGQTMALIYDAATNRTVALDGSSRAPNRATPGLLEKAQRRSGHTASTVPSTPAVLGYLLGRFGTRKLAQVLEPAIELADEGFPVTELLNALTRRELKRLRAGTAAPLFLRDGGKPYTVGSLLKQPALAGTLRRIASKGIEDFYTGRIARAIHEDMVSHEGLIQRDDLAQIPWPIERRPLSCRFGPYRVRTMPPPGAGRTLVQMLNVYQHLPEKHWIPDSPEGAVLMAEVIRRANLDRRDRPYDPNFFAQVQERRALSDDYAQLVARQVRRRMTLHGETTHLSAMDVQGNGVALTQSIERVYGSFAASPELGFLYNNYMSAFEYEDITHPYHLRPNAVPWASVAPTIVFRGRRPRIALGSPGSERIASALLQVLLRLQRQSPLDAIAAPRLHCSVAGTVSLEASRLRSDIPAALRKRGFALDEREPFSFYLGCVQLVIAERKSFVGVADPRRDGAAHGP